MSDIANFNGSQISKHFASQKPENDLSSGIASSFAIVGYKGKVWSIKYRGDEQKLLRPNNDGPVNSIEAVVVGASRNISKIYYASGYTEGANAAPDCFSNDGVVPDASAAHKQNPTCANCPRNVWGATTSAVTGKPKKECTDNKRLALVPLGDISNEVYGGPMLLRVPPASLQELAHFGNKMSKMGYPYYSFGTRISFATEESYPKFQFSAIRPLTDQEAQLVIEMRDSPLVARILSESAEFAQAPQEAPSGVFEASGTWSDSAAPKAPTPAIPTGSKNGSTSAPSPSAQPVEPNTKPATSQALAGDAPQPTPSAASRSAGTAATAATAPIPASGSAASPTPTAPPPSGTPSEQPASGAIPFEQQLDALVNKLLPD